MITKAELTTIFQRSAKNKWTYPQLFDALKEAGVERYETDVLNHRITYFGGGTSLPMPSPEGWKVLECGPKYDEPALKEALRRTQSGQSTYPEFLSEIAAAGIPFYRVDMKPRTVTYHGANRKDKLVEKVP